VIGRAVRFAGCAVRFFRGRRGVGAVVAGLFRLCQQPRAGKSDPRDDHGQENAFHSEVGIALGSASAAQVIRSSLGICSRTSSGRSVFTCQSASISFISG
jgi:hypothetical protein